MLGEFVITPDVFVADDDVLRHRLNDLREMLLPRLGVSAFAVCQLGSDRWRTAVCGKIAAIRNPELRSNAMALFERVVNEVSVVRPLLKTEALVSERSWIAAAEHSASQMTLDGIVANKPNTELKHLLSVEQFASDEVCERFRNPRFVARTEEAQLHSLRTICLHAEWLILRLPQIRGGVDDEIVTLKQVLKLASTRFSGQRNCSVELHVCRQDKIPDARIRKSILDEVSGFRSGLADVDVLFFPKKAFTDRQLFAGEWAPMPHNERLRRVRWLVTMTHVAIGKRREASAEPCTWSLFDRKSAYARLKQIEDSAQSSD